MSEQQATLQARTNPEGYTSWPDFWKSQGMQWRTEPEIGVEQQQYLTERRAIQPDIQKGVFPFKDIVLNRADVEWLLATHESGGMRGPLNQFDPSQRIRKGLDLRGANLRGCDLHALPLAGTQGGLVGDEWRSTTDDQRVAAGICLDEADLTYCALQWSIFNHAHMRGAKFREAHLEGAELFKVHMEIARWPFDFRMVFLDGETLLTLVHIGNEDGVGPELVNVHWNGVNISTVIWPSVQMLGDEYWSKQRNYRDGTAIDRARRFRYFQDAVRANRQLANVLRAQGINEDADRFAYRAQVLQRRVLIRRFRILRYLGSMFLDLISGYGYKPMRSLISYIIIICLFAGAYLLNAQFAAPHLTWDEALVLSISAFHGRGFFTSGISLGDTLARLAAGEAIIGLLIEITFIATFTQRFFAR